MLPLAVDTPFLEQVQQWAITWLPILLMCALVYLDLAHAEVRCRGPSRSRSSRRHRARSAGTTSPAATRPSTSCARWSSSCATRTASRSSAQACRRASCCTGRPAPARRCWRRRSRHESGAQFFSQSASSFVEMFAGLGAARIRRLFAIAKKNRSGDPLHRRARRDRAAARLRPLAREGPDAEPAAGRDGRLRGPRRPDRDRGLQPHRRARPGAAAPGPLRPPGAGRRRPTCRAASRSSKVHTRDEAGRGGRPRDGRAPARSGSPAPTSPTSATRRRSSPAARVARRSPQADFDGALERVVAGLQTRRVITPEREEGDRLPRGRARARLRAAARRGSTLHKISIVPRGRALGYTLNLPEEDRYLMSKEELLDHMKMLLGGFVAEQLVFGRTTTGASDDLRRVAEISRAMIEGVRHGQQAARRI